MVDAVGGVYDVREAQARQISDITFANIGMVLYSLPFVFIIIIIIFYHIKLYIISYLILRILGESKTKQKKGNLNLCSVMVFVIRKL